MLVWPKHLLIHRSSSPQVRHRLWFSGSLFNTFNTFSSRYRWAIGTGQMLPSAYVLPKSKKTVSERTANSVVLQSTLPSNAHSPRETLVSTHPSGVPATFCGRWRIPPPHYFENFRRAVRLEPFAGFFTSINTDRFIQSWYMLLYLLSPRMNTNHDQYFSISPQKTNRPGDIIKGKAYRNLNVTRKLRVGDIPELIIAALQMQDFALGSMTYRQAQGSPMGSPLSLALCLMVVSLSEQLWHRTYSQMLSNSHFTACMLRYVDNRLIVLPPSLAFSSNQLSFHHSARPRILRYSYSSRRRTWSRISRLSSWVRTFRGPLQSASILEQDHLPDQRLSSFCSPERVSLPGPSHFQGLLSSLPNPKGPWLPHCVISTGWLQSIWFTKTPIPHGKRALLFLCYSFLRWPSTVFCHLIPYWICSLFHFILFHFILSHSISISLCLYCDCSAAVLYTSILTCI